MPFPARTRLQKSKLYLSTRCNHSSPAASPLQPSTGRLRSLPQKDKPSGGCGNARRVLAGLILGTENWNQRLSLAWFLTLPYAPWGRIRMAASGRSVRDPGTPPVSDRCWSTAVNKYTKLKEHWWTEKDERDFRMKYGRSLRLKQVLHRYRFTKYLPMQLKQEWVQVSLSHKLLYEQRLKKDYLKTYWIILRLWIV